MLSDQELANMGMPPLDETYKVGWDDNTGILEALVGTSLMISRVSPPFRSTTFTPQVWETTARDAEIRQGPGSNYGLLYTVPAGEQVYIEQHANNMTGILAKGHFWWKVYYGTDTPGVFYKGWMREDDIVGGYLPGDLPTPTATLAVSPTPSETPTITLTPTITPTPKPTATLTPTPEGYIRPTEFSYMPMVQSEFTSISKSGLEKIDIASPYYKLEWR